jgi:hypothetical protein
LANGLFERAQLWANQLERPVADFLSETIELSLLPLGQAPKPALEWTNGEVRSNVCPRSGTGREAALFNPRQQHWPEHFSWTQDGTRITGETPCGRATVIALQLNNVVAVTVRRYWVQAGWHSPQDPDFASS